MAYCWLASRNSICSPLGPTASARASAAPPLRYCLRFRTYSVNSYILSTDECAVYTVQTWLHLGTLHVPSYSVLSTVMYCTVPSPSSHDGSSAANALPRGFPQTLICPCLCLSVSVLSRENVPIKAGRRVALYLPSHTIPYPYPQLPPAYHS